MAGRRILLLAKTTLAMRLEDGVLDRLVAHGVIDRERVALSAQRHDRCLEHVRACLAGHMVEERRVEGLTSDAGADKELVITVGGDGTVLTASALAGDLPMITVNSDPGRSIGMYTRCTADTFASLFQAWSDGRAGCERIPRLELRCPGLPTRRILNECLFASANPAAMSRYLIEAPIAGVWEREEQRSSGVWVATASGSTAAIHSAGMPSIDAHLPALLFQVREPFQGLRPMRLLSGSQVPPIGLRLAPAMPGISVFIDGPYLHWPIPPGATVEFMPGTSPLQLVSAPA